MHRETAIVIKVDRNLAQVLLAPADRCSCCPGQSLFCSGDSSKRILRVKNDLGARIGDEVTVEIKTGPFFKSIFLVFGLPIITGMLGVILARGFNNDIWSAGLGLIGVAIGIGIAKIAEIVLFRKRPILPEIVEIKR